jgi:ADP-ribose pyrophosphatase YjhB (NUDIX family)
MYEAFETRILKSPKNDLLVAGDGEDAIRVALLKSQGGGYEVFSHRAVDKEELAESDRCVKSESFDYLLHSVEKRGWEEIRSPLERKEIGVSIFAKTHVRGYVKRDGRFVRPHDDKRPSPQSIPPSGGIATAAEAKKYWQDNLAGRRFDLVVKTKNAGDFPISVAFDDSNTHMWTREAGKDEVADAFDRPREKAGARVFDAHRAVHMDKLLATIEAPWKVLGSDWNRDVYIGRKVSAGDTYIVVLNIGKIGECTFISAHLRSKEEIFKLLQSLRPVLPAGMKKQRPLVKAASVPSRHDPGGLSGIVDVGCILALQGGRNRPSTPGPLAPVVAVGSIPQEWEEKQKPLAKAASAPFRHDPERISRFGDVGCILALQGGLSRPSPLALQAPAIAGKSIAPEEEDASLYCFALFKSLELGLSKAHIRGYHRRDGVYVSEHEDTRRPHFSLYRQILSGNFFQYRPREREYWPDAVKHPKENDVGLPVKINKPSAPSPEADWEKKGAKLTFVPDGKCPEALLGVPMASWTAPANVEDWNHVPGRKKGLKEPPMRMPDSKKSASSGCIVEEADGRIWVVHPTNAFGGYRATFPKGGVEEELSFQANALKEVFEESGLKVEITGFIGDFERSTSITRFYRARRVGGRPTDMGWESQAVSLVTPEQAMKMMNSHYDREIMRQVYGIEEEEK